MSDPRYATPFEIATSMRTVFERSRETGLTASPDAVAQMVACFDAIIEGVQATSRTAEAIADEILSEVALATDETGKIARSAMEGLYFVAHELAQIDLDPMRQRQLAMRLRGIAAALRTIAGAEAMTTKPNPFMGLVS